MKAILLGLLVCLTCVVSADGKYFGGQRTVELPDMPRQRALVVFKDGTETLIVESVVDSDSAELAWVVPVPSEPSEVTFATSGTVATLPTVLSPEIIDADPQAPKFLLPLLLIILAYTIVVIKRAKTKPSQFITGGLLLAVIWFIFSAIVFPVFATAGATSIQGGQWQEADGLESTAVSSTEPGALISWLEESGFNVSNNARTVIKEYIDEGWWFAVARVKGGEGASSPRPLKIVFKTESPVYPMRLTGVGLDFLFLDICVISDSPAEVEGMDTWESQIWNTQDPQTQHPEILKIVWEGCYISRSAGEISGREIQTDLAIGLGGKVRKLKLASAGAVFNIVLTWTVSALSVLLLVFGAVGVAKSWSLKRVLMTGLLAPIVVGALAFVAMKLLFPTVETTRSGFLLEKHDAFQMQKLAEDWAMDIDNEADYRWMSTKIGRNAEAKWGKDVPGGIMREENRVVSFDQKGNPTYFKIADSPPENDQPSR